MKSIFGVFSLSMIALVAGCATGIKGTLYEVNKETVLPRAGYGIVFGRICDGNGLWFRSKSHHESEYLHVGGKTTFALQLPKGDYQLVRIGSPVGVMTTDSPPEFTVVDGAVEYIGSLLPRWSSGGVSRFPGACNSEEGKVVGKFYWSNEGILHKSKPFWVMSLSNDFPSAQQDIRQIFPLLDVSNGVVNLMH